MDGIEVTEAEVLAELGHPSEMRTIAADSATEQPVQRAAHITRRIEQALVATRVWRLSDEKEATMR